MTDEILTMRDAYDYYKPGTPAEYLIVSVIGNQRWWAKTFREAGDEQSATRLEGYALDLEDALFRNRGADHEDGEHAQSDQ